MDYCALGLMVNNREQALLVSSGVRPATDGI